MPELYENATRMEALRGLRRDVQAMIEAVVSVPPGYALMGVELLSQHMNLAARRLGLRGPITIETYAGRVTYVAYGSPYQPHHTHVAALGGMLEDDEGESRFVCQTATDELIRGIVRDLRLWDNYLQTSIEHENGDLAEMPEEPERSPTPPPAQPSDGTKPGPSIVLCEDCCTVRVGIETCNVGTAAYRAIKAVVEAWPNRISLPELQKKAGNEADRYLRNLQRDDGLLKDLILTPNGVKGVGYGVK